jgi:hypothetical protein
MIELLGLGIFGIALFSAGMLYGYSAGKDYKR